MTGIDHTAPLRVAVIIGSTRQGRAGAAIARWFLTHAEQRAEFEIDVVDLLDIDLPVRHCDEPTPAVAAFGTRIDRADAVVVVTPEYNHGIPGALKHAIDQLLKEWCAKPVGFVSYGGIGRGLRSVEQLRLVFSALNAPSLHNSVSINLFDGSIDEHGWVRDAGGGAEKAVMTLLDELAWWATALRTARADSPYVW